MTGAPRQARSGAGQAPRVGRLDISGDFPLLRRTVNGQPLTYLDNAATTQKPRAVLDAIRDYYEGYNANVHRLPHHRR